MHSIEKLMMVEEQQKEKVIKNCFNYLARYLCELFPVCLNAGKISFLICFIFLLGQ